MLFKLRIVHEIITLDTYSKKELPLALLARIIVVNDLRERVYFFKSVIKPTQYTGIRNKGYTCTRKPYTVSTNNIIYI